MVGLLILAAIPLVDPFLRSDGALENDVSSCVDQLILVFLSGDSECAGDVRPFLEVFGLVRRGLL